MNPSGVHLLTHGGLLLAACLVAAACADTGAVNPSSFVEKDSAGLRIVSSPADVALRSTDWIVEEEPDLRLGAGVSGDEYAFHRIIGSQTVSEGRIVVVDGASLELRVFDRDGLFIKRLGGRGKGPGEFTFADLIGSNNDTVFVHDFLQRRLTAYAVGTGDHVTTAVPSRGVARGITQCCLVLADHTTLFRRTPGPISTPVTYMRHRLGSAVVDTFGQYQGPQDYITLDLDELPTRLTLPFTASSTAVAAGSRIYVYDGASAEIRVYSAEAVPTGLWRITGGKREITAEQRRTYVDQRARGASEAKYESLLRRVYGSLEVPAVAAMFQELTVDQEGLLWAELATEDLEARPTWVVFDATGRALGTVMLPRDLEVHSIGSDHVLGRCRDADDVEYVCRHRLTRRTVNP